MPKLIWPGDRTFKKEVPNKLKEEESIAIVLEDGGKKQVKEQDDMSK